MKVIYVCWLTYSSLFPFNCLFLLPFQKYKMHYHILAYCMCGWRKSLAIDTSFCTHSDKAKKVYLRGQIIVLILWGQRTYDSAHALLGPRACTEEGICRGRIGKGRNAWGHSWGWPCPRHSKTSKGRATSRWKLPPKSPLKKRRVEWDPRGGTVWNWFKVNTSPPH